MEPEQGGGRLGWDPTTTAQSWGRGATGPHPQPSGEPTGASPEQHVAQPHLGKPGSPHKHAPWVPTAFQGSRGSHGRAGRSLEALERVRHALRARGAPKGQGSQPPPPGPFPQPQSAHVYQALPVPTGRGGAGSDIKGLSHSPPPSRGCHTTIGVFPTQTRNGPAGTACWQLRPQSTGGWGLSGAHRQRGPSSGPAALAPSWHRQGSAHRASRLRAGQHPLLPSLPICTRVSPCDTVRPCCPPAPPNNPARGSSRLTHVPAPSYRGPQQGPRDASSSRRGGIWDTGAPSPPEHAPDHPPEPRFQHLQENPTGRLRHPATQVAAPEHGKSVLPGTS